MSLFLIRYFGLFGINCTHSTIAIAFSVSIPIIFSDYAPIFSTISRDFPPLDETSVNLGFGSMKILSANRIEVKDILIKERVEELTIEDIEKQLGYKIKIVNKKE